MQMGDLDELTNWRLADKLTDDFLDRQIFLHSRPIIIIKTAEHPSLLPSTIGGIEAVFVPPPGGADSNEAISPLNATAQIELTTSYVSPRISAPISTFRLAVRQQWEYIIKTLYTIA